MNKKFYFEYQYIDDIESNGPRAKTYEATIESNDIDSAADKLLAQHRKGSGIEIVRSEEIITESGERTLEDAQNILSEVVGELEYEVIDFGITNDDDILITFNNEVPNIESVAEELKSKLIASGIDYIKDYHITGNQIVYFNPLVHNTVNEARNYGGAYDIDPSALFTKEELVDFGEEVCATINDHNNTSMELGEIYLTDNLLEITLIDAEGTEHSTTATIDYRKVKNTRDLNKYVKEIVAKLDEMIKDYYDDGWYKNESPSFVHKTSLDESLFEDIEVETIAGPEEGPEFGLADLLNTAITHELDTIREYNVMAISARDCGHEDIAKLIDEINTEENKHVGQLQEALKLVAPNAEAIDAGVAEGKGQLGTTTE